jgi:hypothetical protein
LKEKISDGYPKILGRRIGRASSAAERTAEQIGGRGLWRRETGMKKHPPKFARNPLISLDSDERIQGNPSFSNP